MRRDYSTYKRSPRREKLGGFSIPSPPSIRHIVRESLEEKSQEIDNLKKYNSHRRNRNYNPSW